MPSSSFLALTRAHSNEGKEWRRKSSVVCRFQLPRLEGVKTHPPPLALSERWAPDQQEPQHLKGKVVYVEPGVSLSFDLLDQFNVQVVFQLLVLLRVSV